MRALGPTLSTLGLSGALADPTMTIGPRKKWNDRGRVGRGLPAALTWSAAAKALSGSTESRPGNEFANLVVEPRSAEPVWALIFYPVINRQLSALGSQSSIGFPSGSFKRAKRPLG